MRNFSLIDAARHERHGSAPYFSPTNIIELNLNCIDFFVYQASFVNFGDSFDLKQYHETTTVAYSQNFRHLFLCEHQIEGAASNSQKQLSMESFISSQSQQHPKSIETPKVKSGFSALSLRQ
jgi:hypothetical protein